MARFKKRHWFSVFACVVILAGGGIGIALHFALKEDKIQVEPRTQPLVDCDPTNPSKQKCEAKGYVRIVNVKALAHNALFNLIIRHPAEVSM